MARTWPIATTRHLSILSKLHLYRKGSLVKIGYLPWQISNPRRGLAADDEGNVYILRGGGTTDFVKLSLLDETVTVLASTPNAMGHGALEYINGKLYTIRGNDTTDFYCYDPTTDTWSTLASVPRTVRYAHNGGGVGNGKYWVELGWNNCGNNYLEEYDPATNTWTEKSSEGTQYYQGSNIVKQGDYWYHIAGYWHGGTDHNNFFKFDGTTWTQLADVPVSSGTHSSLMVDYEDTDKLWATFWDGTNSKLARYSISANAWTTVKDPLFEGVNAQGIMLNLSFGQVMLLVNQTDPSEIWVYFP